MQQISSIKNTNLNYIIDNIQLLKSVHNIAYTSTVICITTVLLMYSI